MVVAHAYSIKGDDTGIPTLMAHHADDSRDREAGCASIHQEAGYPPPTRLREFGIGNREYHCQVGIWRVGDPLLGPVQHPLVPVLHRAGRHREHIRSRIRPAKGEAKCRSEEHTSELQSLMRSSYPGLCLKNDTT